tara:strand:- start:1977 stop:2669 length:693 start_codon:yes stop_codon:yes gene_type:complete
MSYGNLLRKARETAASGSASDRGNQRIGSKGISSKGRSRFMNEDDSQKLSLVSRRGEDASGDDFMSAMFNKVYASNQSLKEQMSSDQNETTGFNQSDQSFLDQLIKSESSGNPEAEIKIKDGRKFVGLLQFGEDRLDDYQRETGAAFSQEDFQDDVRLQQVVAEWHIKDIDKAISKLGASASGFDKNGLRAVAHLGGVKGMTKFVTSGGKYNTQDQNKVSLFDYYIKFSK